MPSSAEQRDGNQQGLAVAAEVLYIINLLLLPGLAFAVLAVLFVRRRDGASPLARSHLEQTMSASLWIAVIFVIAAAVILLLRSRGLEDAATWIIIVIAFTVVHATMVLLGVVGLAKAMAGKCWRYPLVGRILPEHCDR